MAIDTSIPFATPTPALNGSNGHNATAIQDEAARQYILMLKAGTMPEVRPDVGDKWVGLCEILEHYYAGCNGDPEKMEEVLFGITQSHRYADLKTLLSAPRFQLRKQVIETESLFVPSLPEDVQFARAFSQGASPWLDSYESFSRHWSPRGYDDFHVFCGLWVLSTVAARRVRLDFGGKKYTPLFIALVARTTQYAKSTTAKIGYEVLKMANLRWLLGADTTTPQKLLSDMSGHLPNNYDSLSKEDQERAEQRLALSGQRGWYYDEFGQHMDAMSKTGGVMADFKGILRRLDDCFDESEYATISRGSEKIDNPYLSLIASMTPSDVKPYAGKDAPFWRDGFFARFAFLCPPENSRKRDRFPDGEMTIPPELILKLMRWHDALGMPEIVISDEMNKKGEIVGHTWSRSPLPEQLCTLGESVKDAYYRYSNALDDLVDLHRLDTLAGNYGRLAMMALRIAMLLASLENNGHIELKHWAKGQELAERLRRSLHELYNQVNQVEESESHQVEDEICDVLSAIGGTATAREIRNHKRPFRRLSPAKFRELLDDLVRDGMLTKDKSAGSKTETYTLAPPSSAGQGL